VQRGWGRSLPLIGAFIDELSLVCGTQPSVLAAGEYWSIVSAYFHHILETLSKSVGIQYFISIVPILAKGPYWMCRYCGVNCVSGGTELWSA